MFIADIQASGLKQTGWNNNTNGTKNNHKKWNCPQKLRDNVGGAKNNNKSGGQSSGNNANNKGVL